MHGQALWEIGTVLSDFSDFDLSRRFAGGPVMAYSFHCARGSEGKSAQGESALNLRSFSRALTQ